MNKQHVTVSARRIQLFLTELGKGHDESVQNWKDELITHSKMKAMASALEEAVSRHDISGKNFNYELSPADISVNMEPTVDTILFRAAKDSLSTSFCESTFDDIWRRVCSLVREGHAVDSAAEVIKSEIIKLTPDKYQIIGDNIDLEIRAKHMSSIRQNQSIHWFNMYAVKDAVSGREYATTEATNLNDIPESTFLPTPEDNTLLQTDFAFLWSRVIVNSIPDLESLRTAAVWHIPHPYSEQMQQPSEQVINPCKCGNRM